MAATFNAMAISSGALLYGQAVPQAMGGGSPVNSEAVFVSVPVFIVSIFATASFTWMVARHDQKRSKEIDQLSDTIGKLTRELDRVKEAIEQSTDALK